MQHGHYFWLTTLKKKKTFAAPLIKKERSRNKLTSFTCIKKNIWIQKTTALFLLLVQLDCKELVIPRELCTSGWKYQNFVPILFSRHFLCDFLWLFVLPCGLACCSWGGTGHLLIGKLADLSQSAPGSPCLIILGQDTEPCAAFRCIHQSMNAWMTEKSACEACYIKCFKLFK